MDSAKEKSTCTSSFPFLSEDLLREIAGYAHTSALCKLDASGKAFQEISETEWTKRSMKEFGIKKARGKAAWRCGMSFVRGEDPTQRSTLRLKPTDVTLTGSTSMAKGSSIIAITSNSWSWTEDNKVWQGTPILIRDIDSLELMRVLRVRCPVWNLAVCGPKGEEVIVVSNGSQVSIVYPETGRREVIDFRGLDGRRGNSRYVSEYGIPIIASETHLLVFRFGRLHTFLVEDQRFVAQATKNFLSRERAHESFIAGFPLPMFHYQCLAWATDELHHVFSLAPCPGQIFVLKLDVDTGGIKVLQRIDGEPTFVYSNVAVGEGYVAACPYRSKKIHVFNTTSGKRKFTLEPEFSPYWDGYPLGNSANDDFETSVAGLQLSAIGNFLFTTAKNGNSICVFSISAGDLLYQTPGSVGDMGNEEEECALHRAEVSSMITLRKPGSTSFIMNSGYETVWSFYESTAGMTAIENIFGNCSS